MISLSGARPPNRRGDIAVHGRRGSTRLLHELGDRYGEALHEHRRRLRAAFADHDGVEVDTQGDASFVAFGRASDAVAAAADGQRTLANGPIRVRMGLHTGEPRLTDEETSGSTCTRAPASLPAATEGRCSSRTGIPGAGGCRVDPVRG
jgi:hypothetical protein